jgi:tryptophan synthase beta chain
VDSVSAGLDYPGVGPEHSYLKEKGRAHYEVCGDREALDAFRLLARIQGILPALESAHAIGFVMREKGRFEGKTVIVNLSGRGDKDMEIVRNGGASHG